MFCMLVVYSLNLVLIEMVSTSSIKAGCFRWMQCKWSLLMSLRFCHRQVMLLGVPTTQKIGIRNARGRHEAVVLARNALVSQFSAYIYSYFICQDVIF